jgi:hypothetical protein
MWKNILRRSGILCVLYIAKVQKQKKFSIEILKFFDNMKLYCQVNDWLQFSDKKASHVNQNVLGRYKIFVNLYV